jgi:tricorn protease
VRGDAWDAAADSPLNAICVEGIVAINGQLVTRETPPQALLVHQAGTKVDLVLARNGTRRTVLVTTLADEAQARYREWVELKRRWVHTQSEGKVGYLHIPDMMGAGYAEFHRYFPVECDCDGLIIDVRYNRGGHVSQLLLEKVARKRIAYDQQRWGPPVPYPGEAPAGPVVALTNEHAWSDGDIFSHNFKQMGIGPLVGMRTWGGVIGIWPRHRLIDGTIATQPEFSYWFEDGGWSVENYGTDPTIEVDNAPQDFAWDRDAQLEKALAVALELVEKHEGLKPRFGARPNLARRPLPSRA